MHAKHPTLPPGTIGWIESDLDAFRANVSAFAARLGVGTRLAAVVKSNAYGHGVGLLAPAALEAGAGLLAVVNLAEGLELRGVVGAEPEILVLGHVPPAGFESAAENDLQLTIYDAEDVTRLEAAASRVGRPLHVHLKLETGTHRQGLPEDDVFELARAVAAQPTLELAGLSTHFADIEDTTDHAFASGQIELFERAAARLETAGLRPRLLHAACSAAAILFPRTHLDVARAGIGLYGLWPSRETLVSARERDLADFSLRPVMTWKTLVAQVKDVPAGGYVSYGRTFRTTRPSRIAVLPLGYHEGYPRALSGRAHVLVHGRRAPVVGRVCMNMTMVDVTDIPGVQAGDQVVLIGSSGDESIRAEDLADWAGTIHYEIVSRVHPSLPRISV